MSEPRKRRPAPAGTGNGAHEQGQALTRDYIPERARDASLTKAGRVLRALVQCERLTRLDAWRRHGDSCLPSTIAGLQHTYGINIARRLERVEGRFSAAHVARYWIAPCERQDALSAFAVELVKAGAYRTVAEALEALGAADG